MNSHTQDIVLTYWLRWSETVAEEGGIPSTATAVTMFCQHLGAVYPTLLSEIGGSSQEQIKAWIAEDYLP